MISEILFTTICCSYERCSSLNCGCRKHLCTNCFGSEKWGNIKKEILRESDSEEIIDDELIKYNGGIEDFDDPPEFENVIECDTEM